jgi:hypothetical protein
LQPGRNAVHEILRHVGDGDTDQQHGMSLLNESPSGGNRPSSCRPNPVRRLPVTRGKAGSGGRSRYPGAAGPGDEGCDDSGMMGLLLAGSISYL